ncbi:glucose-6-phosphate dehydrogenase [Catenulispora yoronensis]|uniref:Glucose-6-phosphate 1-dehydrogenase n=1 Tax=Catenulispora yoronensis TaxID=450799 RepID=A0ABN2TZK0_9ACTN
MPMTPAITSIQNNDMESADVLVLYGITGDLAKKMLLPALYKLTERGLLKVPVVGVAASDWDDEALRKHARESVAEAGYEIDEQVFQHFAEGLSLVTGDFTEDAVYAKIGAAIEGMGFAAHYLAIPPSLFDKVAAGLAKAGLNKDSRLVVEKPFGHDLASARKLEVDLERYFDRDHLLRVDHFLGDESVEGLGTFRFANTLLAPVWNRSYIDNVQITLAEDFDVADRGSFYDAVGCLRDVVQNHLLQVMTLLAMDPPNVSDPQAQALEKWRLLHSVRTIEPEDTVRGQYEGYLDVEGVKPGSKTETYIALKMFIDNWRWAGVPFYIRSGKALAVTATEVCVQLRRPPAELFRGLGHDIPPNLIRIRLEPGAGIALELMARKSEPGQLPVPFPMGIDFERVLGGQAKPYENILNAAVVGDSSGFAFFPAIEESWRIVSKVLAPSDTPAQYPVGSWGPEAAMAMTGEDGWHKPAKHLFAHAMIESGSPVESDG